MNRRLLFFLLAAALLLLLPPLLRGEAGYFWSGDNARFLAAQTGLLAIGALGMMWIVTAGGLDLSATSIATLAGSIAAARLQQGGGAGSALLLALAAGCGAGALNGGVLAATRLSSPLVTLGTAGVFTSLAAAWMPSTPWPEGAFATLAAPFPQPWFLFLAPAFWIALLLALLFYGLMRLTTFAVHLRAIGSNEPAARLCGVPVGVRLITAYAIAGLLFAGMGVIVSGQLGAVPQPSLTLLADLVIAAWIGRTLAESVGRVGGTLLGALSVVLLRNAAQQAGAPPWGVAAIMALLLIVVLLSARAQSR